MLKRLSDDQPVSPPYIAPGGVQLPPNIEELWNDAELEAAGFARYAPPVSKADLRAYAGSALSAQLMRGVEANVAAEEDPPLMIHVSTTPQGLAAINGAALLATLEPERVFTWAEETGPVQLTAAQVIQAGKAAGAFVQACYEELAAIYVGIENGGVTSRATIDAWEWPQ